MRPILVSALLLALLPGCGPHVLLLQARAATAAGLVLREVQPVAQRARDAELDACAALDDIACIDRVELSWAPVVLGFQLGHDAITSWTSGLALARAFNEEFDSARALLEAFELAVAAWRAIGTGLEAHGLSLPYVPFLSPPEVPHE